MLTGSRAFLAVFVCAVLVLASCSFDRDRGGPSTREDSVVDELADEDLTLTLDGVVVTVPAAAAPSGTKVRVATEPSPDDTSPRLNADGVASVSPTVSVTLGDELQPEAPISITFPVADDAVTLGEGGQRVLLMRSVSRDGSVSLGAGRLDASASTFTARSDHLSRFGVFSVDLDKAMAEARTAVMQGIGLEYAEPDCTEDEAQVGDATYTTPQPAQSWLCVSGGGDNGEDTLSVTASANSVIPFLVTSKPVSVMRTDVTESSVTTSAMVSMADSLGFIGSEQAAVMPGTTATMTFSGAPDAVTVSLKQAPQLLLMAILSKTVDTVLSWFQIDNTLTEALDDLQCLSDLATVAPAGTDLDGRAAGALTRAFFSCAGTLGGDRLSASAKVLLSIIASAPAFLAGAALGIVNEFTGDGRATVELNVTMQQDDNLGVERDDGTSVTVIDPFDSTELKPGWQLDRSNLTDRTLDCDYPSQNSVSSGTYHCGTTADRAVACWRGASYMTEVWCHNAYDPESKTLRVRPSTDLPEQTKPPEDPQPLFLELEDGSQWYDRSGGSWPGRSDGLIGAAACANDVGVCAEKSEEQESNYILVDQMPYVDQSEDWWKVKVGQLGDPNENFPEPVTIKVTRAWFIADHR